MPAPYPEAVKDGQAETAKFPLRSRLAGPTAEGYPRPINAKLRIRKADKPAALDHVLYEMMMISAAYGFLSNRWRVLNPENVATNRATTNAWLEAFAIHARNLNEFFGERTDSDTYILPKDLVPEWKVAYRFDGKLQSRASAEIAHLTYNRERSNEKTQWNLPGIFEAFRDPMLRFLEAVRHKEHLMEHDTNRIRTRELITYIGEIPVISSVPDNTPVPTGPANPNDPIGPRANVEVRLNSPERRTGPQTPPTSEGQSPA